MPSNTLEQCWILLISAAFVNNVVLTRILGLCPFLGISKKYDAAVGMSIATGFVLTIGCGSSFLIFHFLLVPFHVEYLRTISFIVVIAAVVQLTELLIHKFSPILYQVLGIYLPLITTNCAVLGVPLLTIKQEFHFFQSLLFGFGSAFGFGLVLILFSSLRERLEGAQVPACLQGMPIALITAGLMSIAFAGFSDLVRL